MLTTVDQKLEVVSCVKVAERMAKSVSYFLVCFLSELLVLKYICNGRSVKEEGSGATRTGLFTLLRGSYQKPGLMLVEN